MHSEQSSRPPEQTGSPHDSRVSGLGRSRHASPGMPTSGDLEPQRSEERQRLPGQATSARVVAGMQILLAVIVSVLTLTTPFAHFEYSGYSSFGLGFPGNSAEQMLSILIVASLLALAFSAYMWAWRSAGETARKFGRATLVLGCAQWLWVLSVILVMWNRIIYWASFTLHGYYWWVGTAAYAVLVGALILPILGWIAVVRTRSHPAL